MARLPLFTLFCGILIFLQAVVNCAEFEDEFLDNSRRNNKPIRPPTSWADEFFDFGESDSFWPQTRTVGKNDKDSGEGSETEFVAVGGGDGNIGDAGFSSPFFPFGGGAGGGAFGFGNFFPFNFGGQGSYKPWWQGENVCVEREEDIEDWESPSSSPSGNGFVGFSVNFETCHDKPNKHVCTTVTNYQGKKRTTTVTRQCCYGFAPSRGARGHCEKIDLHTIMETAEKLGAKEFVRSAKNNGLEEKLTENITLFVPLDASFTDFAEQMFESNLVVLPLARSRRDTKDVSGISTKELALNHIVKGFVQLEDIENEQLLPTEFENASIRMNIFPKPRSDQQVVYTANCVPLTSFNKPASNGIVHTVEKVLVPVTRTLSELIEGRSDLVVFRTVLEKTDLAQLLSNQDNQFTVFAPNDNAFSKLEPNIRRIIKDGNACALNIIKNHILDLTLCSAAVSDRAKTSTFNLLGEKLVLEHLNDTTELREGSEVQDMEPTKIVINKLATVKEMDLMATNGVLYVIDTVLETNSGTPIMNVLDNQNLTIFKSLLEANGFDEDATQMFNVSFFVPTDKAFEDSKWKQELETNPESLKDNDDLRKFLNYHIAREYVKTCNLSEDMIKTNAGNELRVNLYSTHPIFSNVMNRATVNCARLVSFDVDSCGSVLHQVDRPLEPPSKSLLELLQQTGKYSKFLNLVNAANLSSLLEDTETDYTLLVPRDEVFGEQAEWYSALLRDEVELGMIVKSHILPDVLCCTGFVRSEWPFIRTIQTINQKTLRIDRNRRPLIGNAALTKCDVLATNGVLHEVNDVIIIKESRRQPAFF